MIQSPNSESPGLNIKWYQDFSSVYESANVHMINFNEF